MQRRTVADVDEARAGDGRDVRIGLRVTAVQDRETTRARAERIEPRGRALDDPLGMLERGGGRQHDHLAPSRALE